MRKTTAYARKRRLHTLRGHEATAAVEALKADGLIAIQRCAVYSEEAGNLYAAVEALLIARGAVDDMLHHRVAPEDSTAFSLLGHVVDVAHIRALQIQPDEANPAHQPLLDAKAALYEIRQRRQRTGKWGLSGPERQVLRDAVDIYEELLRASAPAQMHEAVKIRAAAIKKGQFWAPVNKEGAPA